MQRWKALIARSVVAAGDLCRIFPALADQRIDEVVARYPMRINPYLLSLIQKENDPIWRQMVPDRRELDDTCGMVDPLGEEAASPVPNLVHRYPDRVLFLVSGSCAAYCRFCTRKRKVGRAALNPTPETIRAGMDYIRKNRAVRDVLVSGGDPLLLEDEKLADILGGLRAIAHVETIRIGTRVPCTLPQRVTARLARTLKRFHPLYINTHFNHPLELTPEAALACRRLADAGIPLGCQTVLLAGVNDRPQTIIALMRGLLRLRVRPYYLFQADSVRGASHFKTSLQTGQTIMRRLIGQVSGMAQPTYAVDVPGGGKVPLLPDCVLAEGPPLVVKNFEGRICSYDYPS